MTDDPTLSAAALVREFWQRMATNDFASVAPLLAPGFTLDWPQSNERIRGAANFVRMNAEYPSHGRWQFAVHRLVGGDGEAVSEVGITDGTQRATAVSFFRTRGAQIVRIVEYWPEPYAAPANRAHLVEAIDPHAGATP